METFNVILEFLKVLLSAQVVAGVIGVICLVFFREDIKALMRRIAKIRLPGGSEVLTSQAERTSEAAPAESTKPPIPPEALQVPLPPGVTLPPEQMKQLSDAFRAERARAYLWEYRYLNYFLVLHTQQVLDWLASLKDRTTFSFYDNFWLPVIPSAEERKAVINALQAHYLIQYIGELIEVTPKGREYIQWRGPLPSATG